MPYDRLGAANYARSHAEQDSKGECAKYVRLAIQWGGIRVAPTGSAKNYGTNLEAAGFRVTTGAAQKGDVIVIQPAPGHPEGHMAIYDGDHWISDFVQMHGFYPGPAYRNSQPAYKIYRHN